MRISRLINIIMLLLQQEIISATKLAQIFEVSTRSIYRDVETLNLAGIPIYSIRGRNGGIGILPNYKVDKNLLNADDINNLMVALNGVHSLISSPDVKNTIKKIQSMYDANEHQMELLIEHTEWIGSLELKNIVEKINLSIKKQRYLSFSYSDRDGLSSKRKIEPYRLIYKGNRWYVQGYSLKRKDFRTFRLSRISELEFLEESFLPRNFPNKKLALPVLPTPVLYSIKVKVSILARDIFVERFGSQNIEEISEEFFTSSLKLPNNENTYRLLLSFGKRIQIISNGELENSYRTYLVDLISINGLL